MSFWLRLARYSSLASYFSLLVFLVLWYAWLMPSHYFPVALSLLFMAGPLLFPLRGLLAGRSYTHAWTSFLALFYIAHGLSQAWTIAEDRVYASIEALLAFWLFVSVLSFARLNSRANKPA